MGFIFLLIIFFVIIIILALISEAFQSLLEVYLGRPIFVHFMLFPKKLDPHYDMLLNKHFTTFRQLNGKKRGVFASRVARFMSEKTFVIDKEIKDKPLVKVMIAATAVKLTFGLRNYLFPSFHTIAVRPDSYYSMYTMTQNKGETNAAGFIIISWKDFLFGFAHEKDSLNLGYHEFAHALFVEHLKMTMEAVFSKNFGK